MVLDMSEQMTITQADASRRYGVSDRTIRRWDRAKLIEGKRVRGVKLYPLKKMDELAGLKPARN